MECEHNNGWGSRVPVSGSLSGSQGGEIPAPTRLPPSSWSWPVTLLRSRAFKCSAAANKSLERTSLTRDMFWSNLRTKLHTGGNFQSTQVWNTNPPSRAPGVHTPAGPRPCVLILPGRGRSYRQEALARLPWSQAAAAQEAVTFKHKGNEGRGRIHKNYWHGNCFLYKCSF